MKKTILVLTLMLGLTTTSVVAQQDAQFSQYLFNGLYINPAYSGYKETLNLHAFYRKQWTGIQGAPQTFNFALDASANDGNVGLGVHTFNDKLGAQRNNSVYVNYAYRIRFDAEGTKRLAFGLSGGIAQYGIDYSLLRTNDPDALMSTGNNSVFTPDARAGIYYSSEKFFVGVSADNLISSQFSSSKFVNVTRPVVHGYLTAGALIPVSEEIALRPSFLIKEDFNGPTSLDLNAFVLFGEKLWLGGGYRTGIKLWQKNNLQNDLKRPAAAVAAIEIFPTKNIRIGYAYDITLGELQGYSGGTHEISLFYIFGKKDVRMGTPRVF